MTEYEKKYYDVEEKPEIDMVNKPPHYTRDGAMETIEEMILLFGIEETMSFCKLNAWKYRARALFKDTMRDINKSDWYLKKYRQLKELNDKPSFLTRKNEVEIGRKWLEDNKVPLPYIPTNKK